MKWKSGIVAAVCLIWLLGCAPASPSPQGGGGGRIRVGSFNIETFGTTKASRPNTLTVLASIASTYDALAVEEVGSNGSTASEATCGEVLDAYVARINEIDRAASYAYVRNDQYAVVYRTDKLELLGSGPYAGAQGFTYRPLTAYFRTREGNLDFILLVIHTRPSLAREEILALKTAMAEVSVLYSEPDVICLGDFNADGTYYEEGTNSELEGFPSSDYITVIPNSADTTVSSTPYAYDRIELSASMESDYSSSWGVFAIGRTYDVSACEGTEKTAGTEYALSDHYPIWAEFYVDRDTD